MLHATELTHFAALATKAQQVLDCRHGIRRADDDDFVGGHGDDRLRPGPAARGVEDHLRFVDHGHVDGTVRRDHLDRARDHARFGCGNVLFAGEQRTRDTARREAIPPFEREQTQRREVSAVKRLGQALERRVRLAAVRWAHVKRDAALQAPRFFERVRVALERKLAVQTVQRLEFGDAVFPAVLRARAGCLQLGERLRRCAFRLQARQQRFDVARLVGAAARDQTLEVRDEFCRVGVGRRWAQRFEQGGLVARAVEGPDGCAFQIHTKSDRHAPTRFRQIEVVAHESRPLPLLARHAKQLERGAALQHQGARVRRVAQRVEVRDRAVHQLGCDPAARALPGDGLLQQHETQLVEVEFEALAVLGDELGRFDDLRQRVSGLADASELFFADVCRHAFRVARVGQIQGFGRGVRGKCGVGGNVHSVFSGGTSADLPGRDYRWLRVCR